MPDPYTATTDGQLSNREQADLATCEAALDSLRVAFWAAGKALQVIRDARLYRDTHATFEDYCGGTGTALLRSTAARGWGRGRACGL